MDSNYYGSSLRDYLRIIFRHKAVIITTFITVMISVFIGLELKTPIYRAQVKMLISAEKQTSSPYYRDLGSSQAGQISLTQTEIVKSNPVIERAVKALKLLERPPDYEKNYCSPLKALLIDVKNKWLINQSHAMSKAEAVSSVYEQTYDFRRMVEGLKDSIEVEPIRDTELFTIITSDYDPEMAANIANVISRSYVIFDLEQQLAELRLKFGDKHQVVMQLNDNIKEMTNNLTVTSFADVIGPASVKIIEQAQIPFMPTGKSKHFTLLLAFFMSLFLGVMLTFGFEYIDHTFKSPQDVETFLNLPLLGAIPKKGFIENTLIDDTKRVSALTQSYQNLSDQVYLLIKDKHLKSIIITASSPSDGSTTITANLCNFLSNKAGHNVIVIDANLRSPTVHKVFNLPDTDGLSSVLEGKVSLDKAIQQVSPNLAVLPAGKTSLNPITLFDSSMMHNLIKTVKDKYEIIVIDYANLNNIKEVYALSARLDGIVLVVNENKTRHQVIKTLITPFKQKKSNIIGVILNNRTFAVPRLLYERF